MHANSQCYLFPNNLPEFHDARPAPVPTLDICVVGGSGIRGHRDYSMQVTALASLRPKGIQVTLYQRRDSNQSEFHRPINVSDMVTVSRLPDYIEFHKAASQCHILLPLIGPSSAGSNYFTREKVTVTGSLPILAAHRMPSVMHTALDEIYHHHLTAPATVYNDTTSFVSALEEMSELVGIQNVEVR